jgi:death-on-curing protein
MNPHFVRGDVLRNVHGRLIQRYGGMSGVRDENALESAIARPRNLQALGGVTSVPQLGAALAWALLRNHPFTDGNKRSALAAMDIFFELNGHRLICTEVEETAMVLRAAAGDITEEDWTDWVERSVAAQEG